MSLCHSSNIPVLEIYNLKGREHWGDDVIRAALAEEALAAVMMPSACNLEPLKVLAVNKSFKHT